MEPLKIGVVGAGRIFTLFHQNGAKETGLRKFTAIYDVNHELAEKVAAEYPWNEMKAYPTLEEMLASDIDAVLVGVPHLLHEEIVEQCADAGKHVLCEKPMATSVEGCQRMIDAAKRNHVKLMIAENHRFLPAHGYIHDIIEKGWIGEVNLFRAYEGVNEIPAMRRPGIWKGETRGGGAWLDMTVHKYAALEYMLNDRAQEVTAVMAKQVATLEEKGEDNAISITRFASGALGEITVSFTQVSKNYNSLEIHGTKGTIIERHDSKTPMRIFSLADEAGEWKGKWFVPEIEHDVYPFYQHISARIEDDHFAHCVLDDTEPVFKPEQAMSAVIASLMGYLSFIEKRPVTREEILELAKKGETKNIYDRLNGIIPTKNHIE